MLKSTWMICLLPQLSSSKTSNARVEQFRDDTIPDHYRYFLKVIDPSWNCTEFTEQSIIPSRRIGLNLGLQIHCELAALLLKTVNNSLSAPGEEQIKNAAWNIIFIGNIVEKKNFFSLFTACKHKRKWPSLNKNSCWHFTFLILLYLQRILILSTGKWHFPLAKKMKIYRKMVELAFTENTARKLQRTNNHLCFL